MGKWETIGLSLHDWLTGSPQVNTYTYDALNRLTSGGATGGTGGIGNYATESYGYDTSNGNLNSKAGVSYSYAAQAAGCPQGALDKAHNVTSVGGGATTYCYDQNGNMVRRDPSGSGNNHDFTYDAENRLIKVKYNGAVIATFVYDGDGNRVKATVGGTTTTFIGTHFEWTGSTSTMVKYYYAGTQRIAMRTGGSANPNLKWLLGDHLGSTSLTADYNAANPATTLYKPWGEIRYQSGTLPTHYTYTGQYSHTTDFGLMFYVARWYDPVLGRFAQADTLVPGAGNPLAWDRYAYVNNSPLNYNDPSGHMLCSPYRPCEPTTPYHRPDYPTQIVPPYYDSTAMINGSLDLPVKINPLQIPTEDSADTSFSQYRDSEGNIPDPIGAAHAVLDPYANIALVNAAEPDANISIFYNIYDEGSDISSIEVPGVWVTNNSDFTLTILSISIGNDAYAINADIGPGGFGIINLPQQKHLTVSIEVLIWMVADVDDAAGGIRTAYGAIYSNGTSENLYR